MLDNKELWKTIRATLAIPSLCVHVLLTICMKLCVHSDTSTSLIACYTLYYYPVVQYGTFYQLGYFFSWQLCHQHPSYLFYSLPLSHTFAFTFSLSLGPAPPHFIPSLTPCFLFLSCSTPLSSPLHLSSTREIWIGYKSGLQFVSFLHLRTLTMWLNILSSHGKVDFSTI